jgi:hypothetical protein
MFQSRLCTMVLLLMIGGCAGSMGTIHTVPPPPPVTSFDCSYRSTIHSARLSSAPQLLDTWCQTPGQPIITVENGQFTYTVRHPNISVTLDLTFPATMTQDGSFYGEIITGSISGRIDGTRIWKAKLMGRRVSITLAATESSFHRPSHARPHRHQHRQRQARPLPPAADRAGGRPSHQRGRGGVRAELPSLRCGASGDTPQLWNHTCGIESAAEERLRRRRAPRRISGAAAAPRKHHAQYKAEAEDRDRAGFRNGSPAAGDLVFESVGHG